MPLYLLYTFICIVIHEFGHYITAVICKIKVKEFNVGTGKTIFTINKLGTVFKLAIFPLGGSVLLDFNTKNPSKKVVMKVMAIALGGPMINLIVGVLTLNINFMFGFLSILSGLGNLVPTKGSDGYNFIGLTYYLIHGGKR